MGRVIEYKGGFTMDEMVDLVISHWRLYEGTRTDQGKDFSKTDVRELAHRLNQLSMYPDKLNIDRPDMKPEETADGP